MLNILYIIGGLIIAKAFFTLVGSVFTSSEKAASSYMTVVFKMLQLRLLAAALVILFFFFLMGKFNLNFDWKRILPGKYSSSSLFSPGNQEIDNDVMDSPEWKHFKGGDTFMEGGVKFTLIDINTYKLDNLKNFPTIKLSGKTFYKVRKAR